MNCIHVAVGGGPFTDKGVTPRYRAVLATLCSPVSTIL